MSTSGPSLVPRRFRNWVVVWGVVLWVVLELVTYPKDVSVGSGRSAVVKGLFSPTIAAYPAGVMAVAALACFAYGGAELRNGPEHQGRHDEIVSAHCRMRKHLRIAQCAGVCAARLLGRGGRGRLLLGPAVADGAGQARSPSRLWLTPATLGVLWRYLVAALELWCTVWVSGTHAA